MRDISIAAIVATTFASITSPSLLAQDLDAKCKQQEAINFWTPDCMEWKRQRDADLAAKSKADEEARATYWKNQREQQAQKEQESVRQEAEAIKKDKTEGYKFITFEDFALDAPTMIGAKVSVRGLYVDKGERLIRDPVSAARWVSTGESVKGVNIPLRTESASRDARANFLRCANANTPLGCGMVIRGRVEMLTLRNRLGNQWREVGISVEGIRP